jgi:hypothetical protein
MAEQTAVDWLFDQIPVEWSSSKSAFDAYQQAKQMEEKQIIDAWVDGTTNLIIESDGEQYYNETYGKTDSN